VVVRAAPASAMPQQAKLWGAQGEVLAGLQQKLKYSERERTFCCLVAECAARPGALAGVVEVSLQGEAVRRARPAPSRSGCLRAGAVARMCKCRANTWKPLLQAGDEVDIAAANDSDAQAVQRRGRRRARGGCLGAVLLLRREGLRGASPGRWPRAAALRGALPSPPRRRRAGGGGRAARARPAG